MKPRLFLVIGLVIFAIIMLANTVLVVDAGHVAVVFNNLSGHLS
jgi:regulator of protease activity HflC (stomatin/prohibitin superfamily)